MRERNFNRWAKKSEFGGKIAETKKLRDHPTISVTALSGTLGVSRDTVHKIQTEELGLRKTTCRWTPKIQSNEEKQKRVDISMLKTETLPLPPNSPVLALLIIIYSDQ